LSTIHFSELWLLKKYEKKKKNSYIFVGAYFLTTNRNLEVFRGFSKKSNFGNDFPKNIQLSTKKFKTFAMVQISHKKNYCNIWHFLNNYKLEK